MRGAPTEGSAGRQRRKKKGSRGKIEKGSSHRGFDALPPASIDTSRARLVPRASAACVCRQMSTARVTYCWWAPDRAHVPTDIDNALNRGAGQLLSSEDHQLEQFGILPEHTIEIPAGR